MTHTGFRGPAQSNRRRRPERMAESTPSFLVFSKSIPLVFNNCTDGYHRASKGEEMSKSRKLISHVRHHLPSQSKNEILSCRIFIAPHVSTSIAYPELSRAPRIPSTSSTRLPSPTCRTSAIAIFLYEKEAAWEWKVTEFRRNSSYASVGIAISSALSLSIVMLHDFWLLCGGSQRRRAPHYRGELRVLPTFPSGGFRFGFPV